MSKAVLMAIQPKYCELIASGKKTIEVRKTIPKLGTPFKVYMYCTKAKDKASVDGYTFFADELYIDHWSKTLTCGHTQFEEIVNGKVIGEFMCYDVGKYETEFYPKGQKQVYEAIYQYNEDEEVWEPVLTNDSLQEDQFAEDTCLSIEDFRNYLGAGEIRFYGLCISDVVIYDKPKELSEFIRLCPEWEKDEFTEKCTACTHFYRTYEECIPACDCEGEIHLTKAPQSWCYVEELSGA